MKEVVVFLAIVVSVTFAQNVEKYLEHFGYHDRHSFHESNLTDSICLFQKTFGLNESGVLDESTLKLMKTPRCGVRDNARAKYYDTAWRKTDLSYYYFNYSPDLAKEKIRSTISAALKLWADVTPLKFTERNVGDINIAFGSYRHKDSRGQCYDPFDGPWKVLAHAYFPPIGRIHFDESETWTVASREGVNLMWVATHEMGHILGLEHDEQNRDAIMYPYYQAYNPNMHLHTNDIRRIQRLYGKKGAGGGGGGGCINDNESCEKWAKRGECGKRGGWMLNHCCKACKEFGQSGGGGGCKDKDANCHRWAEQGYCEGNHGPWMKANCCKSCGIS